MWLRLTLKQDGRPILMNFDLVTGIIKQHDGGSFISVFGDYYSIVCEEMEEIEIMLVGKGGKVKRSCRERDYIGATKPSDGGF